MKVAAKFSQTLVTIYLFNEQGMPSIGTRYGIDDPNIDGLTPDQEKAVQEHWAENPPVAARNGSILIYDEQLTRSAGWLL